MIDLALAARMCIFQTVRVLSSITFALMALVLPMAGVQRFVCTMDMGFSGKMDECPMKGGDCCKGDQEVPDCMVTADLLPDTDIPNLDQIPFLKADEVIYLRLSVADLRGIDASPTRSERLRGPPDSREWFLEQRRLLI